MFMSVTTCPQFTELDSEIIQDFAECLQENVEQIEAGIILLDSAKDPDLIHRLFRDIHSLKGNCRMVFLDPLVETIHSLEEIVSDMRQGLKTYVPLYGEFIIAIVLRLNNMIRGLIADGEVKGEPQVTMLKVIEEVRVCATGTDIDALNLAMDTLVGSRPSATKPDDKASASEGAPDIPNESEVESNPDLALFRQLALQLDELNIYQRGRTQAVLDLCLSTNEDLGSPVDIEQLKAAVYLHDIGMSLVPSEILNKPSKLLPDEFQLIKNHIDMGTQLLKRIEGWSEASTMVHQHHEKYNGTGYPNGISHDEIHPGARIIALADTFYAITNQRADRSYKKSLFSAVTLINGESGAQFHPDYVEAFNETVRHRYIARKSI
jgi:HD-GYP domain-containing protein (c-di-GMP phosphodiesterase class II)